MSIERRTARIWPALGGWFDEFPFGPGAEAGARMIRVEEYEEDGAYTVKAELPGIDPDKDVEVEVDHGLLTVRAERSEEKKDKQHSEFRYGSFTRTIQLPAGVDEQAVKASYDKGVLTVTAPLGRPADRGKKIKITRGT